jgi:hypothetical protein
MSPAKPHERSARGHSLPNWAVRATSALPPLATTERTLQGVSNVPKRRHRLAGRLEKLLGKVARAAARKRCVRCSGIDTWSIGIKNPRHRGRRSHRAPSHSASQSTAPISASEMCAVSRRRYWQNLRRPRRRRCSRSFQANVRPGEANIRENPTSAGGADSLPGPATVATL